MVLIISLEEDVSTDYVIEWFRYLEIPFIRINEMDGVNIASLIELKNGHHDIMFSVRSLNFSMSDISGVWFRRGNIKFSSDFGCDFSRNENVLTQIERLIEMENKALTEYVLFQMGNKRSLNNQLRYNTNKLITLWQAQKVGLKIPGTLVTRSKDDIAKYLSDNYEEIITKPIQDIFWLTTNGSTQAQYTEKLSNCAGTSLGFYYSLFQKNINRKYDLRIFFVKDKFYSSAIFATGTDTRSLECNGQTARIVPFILPKKIESRLQELIIMMNISSGSIDMIVDQNGEYYFLELNPVGQYGFLGYACNYHLHREIANFFR